MSLKNKVISNTFWLASEKIISIFGLVFVTSYVAKYIGPSDFGKLSLATYIFGIIQTVAIWGTDTLCVKRISMNYESGRNLLFSLTRLRLIILFLVSMPTLYYLYSSADRLTFYFSIAVFLSTFIYVQDVYIILNDSTYQSKINVISNVCGLLFSLLMRYFISYFSLDVIYFTIPIVVLTAIPFFLRRLSYIRRNTGVKNSVPSRLRSRYQRYIFISGFPLVMSSISVAIYFNVSRLILGAIEPEKELGIYAVAITLGSAWCFINNAFVVSMTPKLYSSTSDDKARNVSAVICQFILMSTFLYLIFFVFLGRFIISKLYGIQFIEVYSVTIPIIISSGLSSLGMPTSRYIIYHDGHGFLGKKSFALCFLAIIISYLCIHFYGLIGAAYSTVIIEVLSLTFLNYFFSKGITLKMHLNIFNPYTYRKI